MNSRLRPPAIVLALLAALAATPAAADVFVIVNDGLKVGVDDIRDIFLGERQFAGALRLVPIDNAAVQEQFLTRVLRVDAARYNSMWTKKSFREGLNAPALKSGDAEVIDYVRRTPGAIGYVGKAPADLVTLRQY